MRSTLLLLVLAQTLAPADIDRAIAEGQRTKKPGGVFSQALMSPYDVTVQGPLGRVQGFGAESAIKLLPLAPPPPALLEPHLSVTVSPRPPASFNSVPFAVTHVVMRYKDGTVIQPLTVELVPLEWGNALGAKVSSVGARATFPLLDRPGDVQIVIANAAGQQKTHTIKSGDRGKLR